MQVLPAVISGRHARSSKPCMLDKQAYRLVNIVYRVLFSCQMNVHEAMLLRHICVFFYVWAFSDHPYALLARELTYRRRTKT